MKITNLFFLALAVPMLAQAASSGTSKALFTKVIASTPDPWNFLMGIWAFAATGSDSALSSKRDQILLDDLLVMKGATPDQISQIHALQKTIKDQDLVTEQLIKTPTGNEAESEKAFEEVLRRVTDLQSRWKKLAGPLVSNVYHGLYYQAIAQDSKLAEALPEPDEE